MKTCPYCAEEISKDSSICEYCWEEQLEPTKWDLETPLSKLNITKGQSALAPLSSQIINHLEFLWYECEGTPSDKVDILVCMHETKSNLVVYCNHKDAYSFISVRYTLDYEKELKINKDYYENYNNINSEAMFTRWFSSKSDDGLMIVNIGWTYYWYEKISFWKFIEYFDLEIKNNLKSFSNYTKE